MAQPKAYQPQHLLQLQKVLALSQADADAALAITDYKHPDFVNSEVLSILVRNGGSPKHLREMAASSLNRRILWTVVGLRKLNETWGTLLNRPQVLEDTIQTVWVHLLKDSTPVAASEVHFRLFAQGRAMDYLRSLMAKKRSDVSYDQFVSGDLDDEPFVARIADDDAPGPEETALREELRKSLYAAYMALPKKQRNAVYYRLDEGHSWKQVAEFMKCSEPTANKHYDAGIAALLGVHNDAQ